MTREEAIRILSTRDKYGVPCGYTSGYQEALDMAIEALQNPSAEPDIVRCKDCKYYSPMNRETKTGICNLTMHQNFWDNWFCAGAKRLCNAVCEYERREP